MPPPRVRRFLLALWLLGPAQAAAVVVSSGDGTGNTTAPPDDPGWAQVGQPAFYGAVHLRNNWMLTADHVVANATTLDGKLHPWIPGSEVRFRLGGGTCPPAPAACPGLSDLKVYKIQGDVDLPSLAIRSSAPPLFADVLLVGFGVNRGTPVTACSPPRSGWEWGGSTAKRWGTNLVGATGLQLPVEGRTSIYFASDFTDPEAPGATEHESQAAPGDSGGAVFLDNGVSWELAGILSAASGCGPSTLFGDLTFMIDLSAYRSDIEAVVNVPPCSDGFDDDGDGLVDLADPGCFDASDLGERDPLLPCDDGADNDDDGSQDFPADIGCLWPISPEEDPACSDGTDNDGDGKVDWDGGGSGDPDPDCQGHPWNRQENSSGCGAGFELAVLLPLLRALRRRRRALCPGSAAGAV